MNRTGVIWEPIYTEHVMNRFHPETPARLLGIKEVLDKTEVGKQTVKLRARPATKDEIAWVHDKEYIDLIEKTEGKTVALDPDTTACPKTWESALMAAGGTMECVRAVIEGEVDNAYAFVRPPGHHAESSMARGFCIFNNIAIAAEYAVRKHDIKRIAIVDFDVHHGNGTEHAFYDRPDVFYISTHRWPYYPGTGSRNDHGQGKGKGYTLNIPFAGGADDGEYRKVYEEIVFPVVAEYKPEIILVSAGYDAHQSDVMGGMNVTTETYNWITQGLLDVANRCCNGNLVMVLEGGYDIEALKECVEGALKVLEGGNHV